MAKTGKGFLPWALHLPTRTANDKAGPKLHLQRCEDGAMYVGFEGASARGFFIGRGPTRKIFQKLSGDYRD